MSDDLEVIRHLVEMSGADVPHTLLHYLYLPTNESASKVAKELKVQGFQVEKRLGGDGVNWLVLVSHKAVPTEQLISSLRTTMEALVSEFDGEYDGWEAELAQRGPATH